MDTHKEPHKVTEKKRQSTNYLAPFDEMERAFENFFHGGWVHPFNSDITTWPERVIPFKSKIPRMDVIDQDDKIIVRAEAPGINKDDLEVTLSGNTLTIEGHTEGREEEEKKNSYCREISAGKFSRSIMLPAEIDDAKSKAIFTNGVLELTFPKIVKSKKHKLEIEN